MGPTRLRAEFDGVRAVFFDLDDTLYPRSAQLMRMIGERITEGIAEIYPYGADTIVTEAVFKHVVEDLELPVRRVTPEEYQRSKAAYDQLMAQPNLDMTQNTWRVYRFKNAVERYETQDQHPTFSMELHVLRLGDIAIAKQIQAMKDRRFMSVPDENEMRGPAPRMRPL